MIVNSIANKVIPPASINKVDNLFNQLEGRRLLTAVNPVYVYMVPVP